MCHTPSDTPAIKISAAKAASAGATCAACTAETPLLPRVIAALTERHTRRIAGEVRVLLTYHPGLGRVEPSGRLAFSVR